jgi:hypothetical protein
VNKIIIATCILALRGLTHHDLANLQLANHYRNEKICKYFKLDLTNDSSFIFNRYTQDEIKEAVLKYNIDDT